MNILKKHGQVDDERVEEVLNFVKNNNVKIGQAIKPTTPKKW